ncbi:ABC transporter substrate-binding protein [Pseudomonas putida]|uniref:ABC transporter substrate-binding protein n=1 Tax=Pseudomonas putida TaxID=303 RepID=UPI003A7F44DA
MKQQPGKRKPALWGILLLAACAAAPASRAAEQGPQLVYSWPVNAGPLDPRGYSPNQMYAQAMVYEPLVRYTAAGTLEPWLAEAWQVSDDGKTYTFTLRDGVRFSDGTPFDAPAAKANLDAVLANTQRHRWMELVTTLDHVEAPERLSA